MEYVKRPHAGNLVRFAENRNRVLVLSADLTSSCEADDFQRAYSDRFISFGLAEQNMMGFAAGLAREGFYPYVHTFAVFICRRPYDQVAMSIAYPNLPVRLIGFLPGITTPGGVTHQAIDDIGLMRLLPNMVVLECGDATDVESVLDIAQNIDGPVYIRMLRGEVPRLFKDSDGMIFNQARVLQTGDDIVVLTSGVCTSEAMLAVSLLQERGVSITHLHVSTLKPFDDPTVLTAIATARKGVITMENHSIIGGLGAAVAETIAEGGLGQKLIRIGLQDVYAHGASFRYLMREYGLDALGLIRAVEGLLDESFAIQEQEIQGIDLTPRETHSKPEEL